MGHSLCRPIGEVEDSVPLTCLSHPNREVDVSGRRGTASAQLPWPPHLGGGRPVAPPVALAAPSGRWKVGLHAVPPARLRDGASGGGNGRLGSVASAAPSGRWTATYPSCRLGRPAQEAEGGTARSDTPRATASASATPYGNWTVARSSCCPGRPAQVVST